jgi:RimJ/RimL family protein N-acetyltransferase
LSDVCFSQGERNLSFFRPSDGVEWAELLANPDLRASLYPDVRRPPSAEFVVDDWSRAPTGPGDAQFALRLNARQMIGGVRIEDGNLSYFIGRPFWGLGHGHYAVALVMNLLQGTGDSTRFKAFVERDNAASRRILERNGFLFVGFSGCPASENKRLLAYRYRHGRAQLPREE